MPILAGTQRAAIAITISSSGTSIATEANAPSHGSSHSTRIGPSTNPAPKTIPKYSAIVTMVFPISAPSLSR